MKWITVPPLLLLLSSAGLASAAGWSLKNLPSLVKMTSRISSGSLASSTHAPNARKQKLPVSPEAFMTSPEIIQHRGYPVEIHSVTTADGYILEIHRIPHGRAGPVVGRRQRPVFLQHGLFDSDADFLINANDRALGFILADLGYDVWLGNSRGNFYSKKHLVLDADKDDEFWDFSWDEMGRFDIPACIEYVLAMTGQSKLIYIGHSMGTAVFWVAMITNPQLNAKIELMIALAPAASIANAKSPLRHTAGLFNQIDLLMPWMRAKAFLPNTDVSRKLRSSMCARNLQVAQNCRSIIFMLAGSSPDHFDLSILPVISSHNPSGTSVRTVTQFAKNYKSGEAFLPYDYGVEGNYEKYGQPTPPPYDLQQVKAPVYLFWGPNDLVTTPEDVAWLATKLGNLQASIPVADPNFNHWDFLWSKNVRKLLYDRVISLLPHPFL